MLKRHLANVSSKSHLLDQDRITQTKQMRGMLQKSTQEGSSAADQKALEKKLNVAVQNFTEMYSDYGRRRHHELTFHLEQLQRLANPTNFTKMGLWTLGQQSKDSRNPIAGILQKELAITAQQGKKILDQREKIRHCCSNLKEVRYSNPIVIGWSNGIQRELPFWTHKSPFLFSLFVSQNLSVSICSESSRVCVNKRLKSFTIA